jgi:hypothetical protein
MKFKGCIVTLSALFIIIINASSLEPTPEDEAKKPTFFILDKKAINANIANQEAQDQHLILVSGDAEETVEEPHLNAILRSALLKHESTGHRCLEKHALGHQSQEIHLPKECPCTWCTECVNGIIYRHPTDRYRMICYSIQEAKQADIDTVLGANLSTSRAGAQAPAASSVALAGRKSEIKPHALQAPVCDGTLYFLKTQQDSFANKKCWKRLCLINCEREGGILIILKQTLYCVKSTDTGLVDQSLGKLTCINWIR